GRQVWAAVVARDGRQLSATALQRAAFDEAESLRTHEPRLRQVLRDIAEAETIDALARLLGPTAARRLSTAPAWPALHAQLLRLADAGIDTDRLLRRTYHAPGATPANDPAAVLHARNRRALDPDEGGSPTPFVRRPDAPRPATAATYETAPAAGSDILTALGLRLPSAGSPDSPDSDDDRRVYARALARQLAERATALAEQARHAEWATAYGPDHERVAAAAAYRDLADYRGADATGPAPPPEHSHHRALWRAAQLPADDAALLSGATTWLGARPAPEHRLRPLWDEAARAIATYRRLWNHGAEHDALGPSPAEPVQAADHATARRAVARWRRATAGSHRPEPVTAHAHAAADRRLAAQRAAARAAQEAQDLTNRAAVAAAAASPRAAELAQRAAQARLHAEEAAGEREAARRRLERSAPDLLPSRTDA
ncbi:hypothetical protein D7231_34985, partial [Streptomyces klenkii]